MYNMYVRLYKPVTYNAFELFLEVTNGRILISLVQRSSRL